MFVILELGGGEEGGVGGEIHQVVFEGGWSFWCFGVGKLSLTART